MNEIRRIRILRVENDRWHWRDAVTSQPGHAVAPGWTPPDEGDELVVELRPVRGTWHVARVISAPRATGGAPAPPAPPEDRAGGDAPVLLDGRPFATTGPAWAEPEVGQIRTTYAPFTSRSTAERDAGRTGKSRPAVVVWVDHDLRQVGVRLLFGTNSAVRREGRGRRLREWRAAGLRKPSVLATQIEVRAFTDVGDVIGTLAGPDLDLL